MTQCGLEQRVMLGLFGEQPPASVHDNMVSAIKDMCHAAANAIFDERYVGPTEEQLDDIAEEATKRMKKVTWSVRDQDGVRKMTPHEVVKMHEHFLHKYKVRADDNHRELKQTVTKLQETVDLLTDQLETLSTRVHLMQRKL